MTEAERVNGYLCEIEKSLKAALYRVEQIRSRGNVRPHDSFIDCIFLASFLKEASETEDKLAAHFSRKSKQKGGC